MEGGDRIAEAMLYPIFTTGWDEYFHFLLSLIVAKTDTDVIGSMELCGGVPTAQRQIARKSSCEKLQEVYQPWHNLSKHNLSRGAGVSHPSWGGTPT